MSKTERSDRARAGAIKRWQRQRLAGSPAHTQTPLTPHQRQQRFRNDPENRQRVREQNRRRRLELKTAGICLNCRTEAAKPKCVLCEKCAKASVSLTLARRKRFAAAGMCFDCGKCPPLKALIDSPVHSCVCEMCYLKHAARHALGAARHWVALKSKLVAQGCRCAYTGVPLILGVNASIDHIYPIRFYSQLHHDPSNVEWVSAEINVMKRDRTPEQFMSLIRSILNHRENGRSGDNVEVVVSCVSREAVCFS